MNIYISGPMTGKVEFNREAFYLAEKRLRKVYERDLDTPIEIFNPARVVEEQHGISLKHTTGDPQELAYGHLREALRGDMEYLCKKANTIYMLYGWEHSVGARAEHALATALRLRFMYEA